MTEENSNDPSAVSEEETKDNSTLKEEKEIKKLEEKDHFELEYFDKEQCLESISNLEKELKEFKESTQTLRKENDESKNKYMHLQAEFENAQKRWNKSRQDLRTQYTASVLKNFLPLYDSFKKAIETTNDEDKEKLNGFYTQFMGVFKSYGVQPIEVEINDPFDYSLHEALTSVENDDLPENSIIEIIQDGFKYEKDVLRYTKVVISKKPKPPEPEPKEEEIEEEETEETKSEDVVEEKKSKEKKSKKQKKDKEPDYTT
jgi:molecular chaperone GrpE